MVTANKSLLLVHIKCKTKPAKIIDQTMKRKHISIPKQIGTSRTDYLHGSSRRLPLNLWMFVHKGCMLSLSAAYESLTILSQPWVHEQIVSLKSKN